MTLDEIQQQLITVSTANDPVFSQFARDLNMIVEQAKAGQMSNAEVAEILQDAQRQLAILEDATQLAFKETLNTCINGIITIACAV
jgi:membrane-bound lytic murein transglycosylase B